MGFEVVPLSAELEPAWTAFCEGHDGALLYHSLAYRDFLTRVLPHARETYRVALKDGDVVGILPLFLCEGPLGTVANSLPFFGSHGGPLVIEKHSEAVANALLHEFRCIIELEEVVAATVIENPYSNNSADVARWMPDPDYRDSRIGQVTRIPQGDARDDVIDAILAQCHQKTRNLARKGIRAGFSIDHQHSPDGIPRLVAMHTANMQAIGGKAKPVEVFDAILDTFNYDSDFRIYNAIAGGGVCAATMLVLYYKEYVEYFTPCINVDYRSDQPLSALILRAMADAAVERGATRWNWGGTWKSQDGVYRFKSRWGAVDTEYQYFIYLGEGGNRLPFASPSQLASGYPYFYTVPFGELSS